MNSDDIQEPGTRRRVEHPFCNVSIVDIVKACLDFEGNGNVPYAPLSLQSIAFARKAYTIPTSEFCLFLPSHDEWILHTYEVSYYFDPSFHMEEVVRGYVGVIIDMPVIAYRHSQDLLQVLDHYQGVRLRPSLLSIKDNAVQVLCTFSFDRPTQV